MRTNYVRIDYENVQPNGDGTNPRKPAGAGSSDFGGFPDRSIVYELGTISAYSTT